MLREMLADRDEATLRRVRVAASELIGAAPPRSDEAPARSSRIALIGLRGAGKSTLGRMLAEDLDFPFVELSREIEKLAGCSISEILGLYGQNAYRRYERRALEEAIEAYPRGGHRHRGRTGQRPRQLQPPLAPLHDRLADGRPRRPHEPRHGPGRPEADGREPGGDGGS